MLKTIQLFVNHVLGSYLTYYCNSSSRKHILLTCVLHQRPARRDLPQFDDGVFAAGQDVLGVLGEDGRADLRSIMGLLECGDTAVWDAIPELDAAVLAAGDVAVGAGVVAYATDGVRVLVERVAGYEALEGVDIIEAEGGVLCSHQEEVSWRMERDGTQHFGFLLESRWREDWIVERPYNNWFVELFWQIIISISPLSSNSIEYCLSPPSYM